MKKVFWNDKTPTTLPGEAWVDVMGYDGIYSVSNLGRVKSEMRYNSVGALLKERIMTQHAVWSNPHNLKERSKTLAISFSDNGKVRSYNVAVLVGRAFLGECKKGCVFSKKNKKWYDCRAENLEIKTYSDSHKLAYEKGNNLRRKNCLILNTIPRYVYIRLSDGKEFIGGDVDKEYGRQVRTNIKNAIIRNGTAFGSFWERRQIFHNPLTNTPSEGKEEGK